MITSAESEQKAVRRDCIIDIIKIMEVSSPTEKKEHVKKIKQELDIKSVSTAPSVIVKQLTRMLKNLEREIRMANCFGQALTKPSRVEKHKETCTAKNITKILLNEKVRETEEKRAKQKLAKLKAARLAQEKAERMARQVEENQLKKLQSLTLLPESDPVIYSKYDFLATLGLTMSMS